MQATSVSVHTPKMHTLPCAPLLERSDSIAYTLYSADWPVLLGGVGRMGKSDTGVLKVRF